MSFSLKKCVLSATAALLFTGLMAPLAQADTTTKFRNSQLRELKNVFEVTGSVLGPCKVEHTVTIPNGDRFLIDAISVTAVLLDDPRSYSFLNMDFAKDTRYQRIKARAITRTELPDGTIELRVEDTRFTPREQYEQYQESCHRFPLGCVMGRAPNPNENPYVDKDVMLVRWDARTGKAVELSTFDLLNNGSSTDLRTCED